MSKQELLKKADYYKGMIEADNSHKNEFKKSLGDCFKLKCIYGSGSIEGNTLGLTDIRILLEDGITVEGKPVKDYYLASGHAQAYDYMLSLATTEQFDISEDTIRKLHYLYYHRVDHEKAGQYRNTPANLAASDYLPPVPEDLAHLMGHFINQIQSSRMLLHPIEYAALCHKRLLDIYPFESGNGIVARLLLNLILINEGYGMAVIAPKHQDEYLNGLYMSRIKNNPDIDPLVKLVAELVVDSQIEYCKLQGIEIARN